MGVEYSVRIDGDERVQFGQGRQDGVDVQLLAHARREVVVCAGVFFTPHILLKSGVGPKAHLEAAGIPVVADVPGVGHNLLSRVNVLFFYGNGSVRWRGTNACMGGKGWHVADAPIDTDSKPSLHYPWQVVPEMNPFVMRDDATAALYQQEHRGPYSLGALGIYTVVKGRFPGEDDYVVCYVGRNFFEDSIAYKSYSSIPPCRCS